MPHIPRFYTNETLIENTEIRLGKEVSHHLLTVMRKQTGDTVCLFNGDGDDYIGQIKSISKKEVNIHLQQKMINQTELQKPLHLVQALTFNHKLDWILQKAAELGCSTFHPLISTHSKTKFKAEKWEKKSAHWRGIIESATAQCGRAICMETREPATLEQLLITLRDQHPNAVLLYADFVDAKPITELGSLNQNQSAPIIVAIGPESGWTDLEREKWQEAGALPITLGKTILRTETAGLVALSLLKSHCE